MGYRPRIPVPVVGDQPKKVLSYYVGVDLGQVQDPTAVAVLERRGFAPALYYVRWLHQYELLTPYQAIAEDQKKMFAQPELAGHECELVVDATGVGRPVVEMFERVGLEPVSVTITAGFDPVHTDRGEWRVPKRDLVMAVQMLLQSGRLKVAPGVQFADLLKEELLKFKLKVTKTGVDTYEAWREGDHDDLVLAVAIAAWYGEHMHADDPATDKRVEDWRRIEAKPLGDLPY